MTVTKSLDHFEVEITEENGTEFVGFRRICSTGETNPGLEFMRGDKIAGAMVLNQIGDLIGYGEVAKVTE